MIYFKGMLIGFCTVLSGCLIAPIAMLLWLGSKSQGGTANVSYSPLGLAHHLTHSLGFWVFVVVLFAAGFVPSVFFTKR